MAGGQYRVELTPRAQKDLKSLKHGMENAIRQIAKLEDDPYCGERLKGTLRDAWSLHFSLKGGGQYRAIYTVQEDKTVCLVFLIGARENVYDEASRRLKALLPLD